MAVNAPSYPILMLGIPRISILWIPVRPFSPSSSCSCSRPSPRPRPTGGLSYHIHQSFQISSRCSTSLPDPCAGSNDEQYEQQPDGCNKDTIDPPTRHPQYREREVHDQQQEGDVHKVGLRVYVFPQRREGAVKVSGDTRSVGGGIMCKTDGLVHDFLHLVVSEVGGGLV